MCGRAKLPDDVSEIKLDLKIDWDEIGDYRPRWNAAPTSKLPVVVANDGKRTLTLMRWGLVPSWANGHQDRLFDLQCPRRRHRDAPRVPRRMAGGPPLPRDRRRLLRVARYRQTTLRCGARQSRTDDLRRPLGHMASPGRRNRQVLHHHHHGRQRTSRIPCTRACRFCSHPTHWPAWLGEIATSTGELKAMLRAISRSGHDFLAGRPPRRQCPQRQSGPVRTAWRAVNAAVTGAGAKPLNNAWDNCRRGHSCSHT